MVTPAKVPGLCAYAHPVLLCSETSKLQNIIRERERRAALDPVEEKFVARFWTILPAPIKWSKQLTTR